MAKLSEVVDGLLAPQGAPRSAASNPGTLYEGRSFRGDAMGPRPVGVSDRPDMNVPAAPPAPPGPQRSELGKGFQTGLEGMKELNWSAVAALGQIFGSETVQKWGLENAEAANQRAQETLPRIARIEDIGGARDFVDWTLGTLGQLAPFALESAATAIAGAVVGGAMAGPAGAGAGALAGAGRSGAVKEAIKAAAKGTATPAQQQAARQAMARLGSQVGVVASGYKTGFGDVYNETVEGGDPSPGLAAIAAAPYAALDALPEMVLVNQISKLFGREGAQEVARGLIQRVGIGAVKQALLEGGTEGGQEALLILARRAVQPGYDPTGEETKSRLMNAVAAGAVGGGTIGGAAAAFDTGGPAAAQPGAAVPPGGTVPPGGDVAIDTLEAQPAAPARGIPAPPGSATVSPLMPSGEAQLQPTPTAPAAGQVAPAVPIDAAVPPVDAAPPMEQPPVTAGIPAAPVAPTSRVAPPVADPVAAPVADVATVAAPPAVAGIPQSADAAALLGDDDFNAAAADLGAILQPEPPAAVEPPAAPEPGAIGQELEALAPAKPAKPAKLSKEQRKAQARKAYRDANPFKSFLSDHGVSIDAKLDILGDRKAKNPPVPYGKGPVF
ncbi:MAG: hypothetical protein IOD10_21405, partial [Rhodocyclaceae bacterium]|nr:hypothetical protein [Rhodocyclaceae bacterium]